VENEASRADNLLQKTAETAKPARGSYLYDIDLLHFMKKSETRHRGPGIGVEEFLEVKYLWMGGICR
jgi:hypothetical protein